MKLILLAFVFFSFFYSIILISQSSFKPNLNEIDSMQNPKLQITVNSVANVHCIDNSEKDCNPYINVGLEVQQQFQQSQAIKCSRSPQFEEKFVFSPLDCSDSLIFEVFQYVQDKDNKRIISQKQTLRHFKKIKLKNLQQGKQRYQLLLENAEDEFYSMPSCTDVDILWEPGYCEKKNNILNKLNQKIDLDICKSSYYKLFQFDKNDMYATYQCIEEEFQNRRSWEKRMIELILRNFFKQTNINIFNLDLIKNYYLFLKQFSKNYKDVQNFILKLKSNKKLLNISFNNEISVQQNINFINSLMRQSIQQKQFYYNQYSNNKKQIQLQKQNQSKSDGNKSQYRFFNIQQNKTDNVTEKKQDHYDQDRVIKNFEGKICPDNHICILKEEIDENNYDKSKNNEYYSEQMEQNLIIKRVQGKFLKIALNSKEYQQQLQIEDNQLHIFVVKRELGYQFEDYKTFNIQRQDVLQQLYEFIQKLDSSQIEIIVFKGLKGIQEVQKITKFLQLIGGNYDKQFTNQNSINILVGRKGLCGNQGLIYQISQMDQQIQINLNNNQKFSYQYPTVNEISLKSQNDKLFYDIKGKNLGQRSKDILLVLVDEIECSNIVVLVSNEQIVCNIMKQKANFKQEGNVQIFLRDGKSSPKNTCLLKNEILNKQFISEIMNSQSQGTNDQDYYKNLNENMKNVKEQEELNQQNQKKQQIANLEFQKLQNQKQQMESEKQRKENEQKEKQKGKEQEQEQPPCRVVSENQYQIQDFEPKYSSNSEKTKICINLNAINGLQMKVEEILIGKIKCKKISQRFFENNQEISCLIENGESLSDNICILSKQQKICSNQKFTVEKHFNQKKYVEISQIPHLISRKKLFQRIKQDLLQNYDQRNQEYQSNE